MFSIPLNNEIVPTGIGGNRSSLMQYYMSPIDGSMKSKDGLVNSRGVFIPQTYDTATYGVINRARVESSNFFPVYDGTLANSAEALYKFTKFQNKIQNISRICIGIDDRKVPSPTILPSSHRGIAAIQDGFVIVNNGASGLQTQYVKVNVDGTFTYGAVATIDALVSATEKASVVRDSNNQVVIAYRNFSGASYYVKMVRVSVNLGTLVCTGTPVTVYTGTSGVGESEIVKITNSLYCIAVLKDSTRSFFMVNGSFASIGFIQNASYSSPVAISSNGVDSAYFAIGSTYFAKVTNTGGVPTVLVVSGANSYISWGEFIIFQQSNNVAMIRASTMETEGYTNITGMNIATTFIPQYGQENLPVDQVNNLAFLSTGNFSSVGSVGPSGITINEFNGIVTGRLSNVIYGESFQVMVSSNGQKLQVIPYREFEVYVDGVKVLNSVKCHNGAVHTLNVAVTENSDIVLKNVSGYSTKAYILSAYCNVK